jgi:3-oxoacyl-[acyl-carrier-protein] synthase II
LISFYISGAGMLSSIGPNRRRMFANLCKGVSGFKPFGAFDPKNFMMAGAYEIEDRDRKNRDTPQRSAKWLANVIGQALQEARLDPWESRVAVLVGTGLREHRNLELWCRHGDVCRLDRLHYGTSVREAISAPLPVYTFVNACAASNVSLGLGLDLLTLDQADAVIVAGVDTITETMFGLLDRVTPGKPDKVRPFDADRKGVIMGEGAAAVVIENEVRIRARGGKPLAKLCAVGMSCDAHHETAPDQEGITNSILDAHRRSDCDPEDIDVIFAHGTGTLLNDQVEAKALQSLFGSRRDPVLVSGIKSMIGHTSGASGIIGVVTAIEAMAQGKIPPTLNLENPIAEVTGLEMVRGQARKTDIRLAQVNAFGFGGVNAVAVLAKV